MKPYCPVCKKRVDVQERANSSSVWCHSCGVGFRPDYSERLAPKCSCGADLDIPPYNTLTWTGQMPKCEKCRKEGK